jgi:hypothetical protein
MDAAAPDVRDSHADIADFRAAMVKFRADMNESHGDIGDFRADLICARANNAVARHAVRSRKCGTAIKITVKGH